MNISRWQGAVYKNASALYVVDVTQVIKNARTSEIEFLNKDGVYVNEGGRNPLKITTTFYFDITRSTQNLDTFVKAIEEGGAGFLQLGEKTFEKMVVIGSPSIKRGFVNDVGYATIDVEFTQTQDAVFPLVSNRGSGKLKSLKDKMKQRLTAKFPNLWNNVSNSRIAVQNLTTKLQQTKLQIDKISNNVRDVAADYSVFSASLLPLVNSTATLLKTPSSLFQTLNSIVNNIEGTWKDARSLFNSSSSFVGIQAGNISIPNKAINSSYAKNILTNQNLINDYLSCACLSQAYSASADIEYQNIQDLDNIKQKLEESYNFLMSQNIDEEILLILNEIRVVANQRFDEINLTLPQIKTIQTNNIPISILIYQVNANLDNYSTSVKLNNFTNLQKVAGNIKILNNI